MTTTPNADALERARENPAAVADWLTRGEGSSFICERFEDWEKNRTVDEIWGLLFFWWFPDKGDLGKDAILTQLLNGLHSLPEGPESVTERSLLSVIMLHIPRQLQKRNDRNNPLFPDVFTKKDHNGVGLCPAKADGIQRQQDLFPGFGNGHIDEDMVRRLLPQELYLLPSTSKGKGAPLARRIFVNAVLSVPQAEWQSVEPVELPPETLRRFLTGLFPDSSNWRASRHIDDLLEGIELLGSFQARVRWVNPDTGFQTDRQVVQAVDFPRDGNLNSEVRFRVDIPPGKTSRGVIFDRKALIRAGARSAPTFELAVSLAALWSSPGRTRFPKGTMWLQVRKPEVYPEVTDAMLTAMCYPGGSYPSGHKRTAQEALDFLVTIGYAKVVKVDGTRRILPGPKWAGWDK